MKENELGKLVEMRQYELGFKQVIPPTQIEITSNEQNLHNFPFQNEWLYMTIECKDYSLIDEIELNIKAFPFISKNRRFESKKHSKLNKDEAFEKDEEIQLA